MRRRPVKGADAAKEIIAEIARNHHIRVTAIVGLGRSGAELGARLAVARRLKAAGWSTTEIGWALHRDHSSIVTMLNGGKREPRPPAAPAALAGPVLHPDAVLPPGARNVY